MNNQEERKRVCCNCGNNLRIRNQCLGIHNECAIYGHYISYLCAIFACCKFSGVAVCQNTVTRFYQRQTIFTDGFAHADILVLDLNRLLFQKLFDLGNGLVRIV